MLLHRLLRHQHIRSKTVITNPVYSDIEQRAMKQDSIVRQLESECESLRMQLLEKEERLRTENQALSDLQLELRTENQDMPPLIFTWTQKMNIPGYWGFGDTLRGMIAMYQWCTIHGRQLKIDIQPHPFSIFFDVKPVDVSDSTTVQFVGGDGSLFHTFQPGTATRVYTNIFPLQPISSNVKEMIRSLLTVRPEYEIQLPERYVVYHFRLGDEGIVKSTITPTVQMAVQMLSDAKDESIILCTDSIALRNEVHRSLPHIQSINRMNSIAHVGYNKDHESLLGTLYDFQAVRGASTIYTYSIYGWVSGFVNWVSICYDIPIVNLKKG